MDHMRRPKEIPLTHIRITHADRAAYVRQLRRQGYRRVGPVVMERGLCETWYEKRDRAIHVTSAYVNGGAR
jgi:hypothetical protein